jgi:hypothetical protein
MTKKVMPEKTSKFISNANNDHGSDWGIIITLFNGDTESGNIVKLHSDAVVLRARRDQTQGLPQGTAVDTYIPLSSVLKISILAKD